MLWVRNGAKSFAAPGEQTGAWKRYVPYLIGFGDLLTGQDRGVERLRVKPNWGA